MAGMKNVAGERMFFFQLHTSINISSTFSFSNSFQPSYHSIWKQKH